MMMYYCKSIYSCYDLLSAIYCFFTIELMTVGPADSYVHGHSWHRVTLRRCTEKNNTFTQAHGFSDETQVSHAKCDVAFEREMLWTSHAMSTVQKQGYLTQSLWRALAQAS